MAFEVPPLPYAPDALEPHIDAQTMSIHHDKHHQAYVDKLNAALEGTEHADTPIEDIIANLDAIPEDKRTAVRNNGGGHYNHSLFWASMSPDGGGAPDGDLGAAIDAAFGSFDDVQGEVRGSRRRPVRLGLGLARARRRLARGHEHAQPGQPAQRRQDPAARQRRLGARLLPEVPEQAPGLPEGLVEHGRLDGGRPALQRRKRLIDRLAALLWRR